MRLSRASWPPRSLCQCPTAHRACAGGRWSAVLDLLLHRCCRPLVHHHVLAQLDAPALRPPPCAPALNLVLGGWKNSAAKGVRVREREREREMAEGQRRTCEKRGEGEKRGNDGRGEREGGCTMGNWRRRGRVQRAGLPAAQTE